MIITKKSSKMQLKNIIVDAIKSTNDPMFTKEENKEELSDSMNQCSDERMQEHPSFTTALENIACITSVGELLRTIAGNEEEETQ